MEVRKNNGVFNITLFVPKLTVQVANISKYFYLLKYSLLSFFDKREVVHVLYWHLITNLQY